MSHEIRTPINGIIGFLSILSDMPLTVDQRELVDGIHSAAGTLMSVINDILDISKIEAGKVELEDMDINLPETVRDIEIMFANLATSQSVNFTVTIDLPDDRRRVRCDMPRLRQILNNLLSNALKFTFAGGDVCLALSLDHDMLLFDVTDTGIGIPDDKKASLFMPFMQAESSTTRRFGGSGLGLAISRNLAQLMGGDITFTSVYNVGSTFSLRIPYREPSPVRPSLVSATSAERMQETAMRKNSPAGNESYDKSILIVDDTVMNVKVAVRILESAGFKTAVCYNGLEAMNMLKAFPDRYGLILMDCQMPVMDGYEATRAIRVLKPPLKDIPIVAMTANALKGERENCLAAGMDDYLSKPVEKLALIRLVHRFMSGITARTDV